LEPIGGVTSAFESYIRVLRERLFKRFNGQSCTITEPLKFERSIPQQIRISIRNAF